MESVTLNWLVFLCAFPAQSNACAASDVPRRRATAHAQNTYHGLVETYGGAHKAMTGIANMGCGL